MKKTLLATVAMSIIFVGCSKDSDVSQNNKSALYWYKKIATEVGNYNLDKADSFYLSLKSEHIRTPLLPASIMMLAQAHMHEEEYLLANFYFDEYNKRFATVDGREYSDFMKIKSAFLGITDVNKDQKLMMDTVNNATKFLYRHPNSSYEPLVNTILVRLHMSQYLLNENIAGLYERVGKDKASKIYRDKNKNSPLNMQDISLPTKGFFSKLLD